MKRSVKFVNAALVGLIVTLSVGLARAETAKTATAPQSATSKPDHFAADLAPPQIKKSVVVRSFTRSGIPQQGVTG
jgi:hypothetical protein